MCVGMCVGVCVCVCVCVCVSVYVCVLGRCVCAWGVEYLGDEGQKMVNRVSIRLI